MGWLQKIVFILLSITLFKSEIVLAQSLERPPQYILLAFDGSLNLNMWDETLSFAKNNDLKLTYFISGVYFLLDSNKSKYVEPTFGPGKSAIGWGGTSKANLKARVDFVNEAFDSGHEIGSHVNGHFDGSRWTLDQWRSEFEQFYRLIFDVFRINGINSDPQLNPYHFSPSRIVGFRSPLLGTNPAMYKVLKENSFAYDTSQTAPMNYWPEIKNGIWNFPLAQVRVAGTGKRTISMDYNFYYAQSGGQPDVQNALRYQDEMYKTYMGYFQTNYYGNRAPIHIGHHFSKWNAGAYWNALQQFASTVCRKPEVRCVNYYELLKFMNSKSSGVLRSYQDGDFEKLEMPTDIPNYRELVAPLEVSMDMVIPRPGMISARVKGAHAYKLPHVKESQFVWKVNEKEVFRSSSETVHWKALRRYVKPGNKISVIYEHRGRELLKTSHNVEGCDDAHVALSREDLEGRSMGGDLPEAHNEGQ